MKKSSILKVAMAALVVSIIPTLVFPWSAFAWNPFGKCPTSMETDRSSYEQGDKIKVTGPKSTEPTKTDVWIDTNKNGKYDSGEPNSSIDTGTFDCGWSTKVKIPKNLKPGEYDVYSSTSATGESFVESVAESFGESIDPYNPDKDTPNTDKQSIEIKKKPWYKIWK